MQLTWTKSANVLAKVHLHALKYKHCIFIAFFNAFIDFMRHIIVILKRWGNLLAKAAWKFTKRVVSVITKLAE